MTKNFNPLLNKRPYGAVTIGQQVSFDFPIDENFRVNRVFIILRLEKKEIRYEMKKTLIRDGTAFYSIEFKVEEWGIWHYRFEAATDNGTLYFGQNADGNAINGEWLPEWQLTVTKKKLVTPDWAKGGIIYHIFADRFCRKSQRKPRYGTFHENWNELPTVAEQGEEYLANDFFGGDIEGIISKIPYLKSLNVSVVYLSPIFEASSNHRYDTGDYLKIDPLFGNEELFKTLIQKCKENGIEVMLDGVFNHSGSDSIYFNKLGHYDSLGAYESKQSPYYDWYYFLDYPDTYKCWWGCTVVPTINKSNPDYRKLIFGENGVLKKWTSLGVKGWRLDVVDELEIDFVDELRKAVKSTDPDCLIIGEVWENATTKISYDLWRPYLFGDQLDGVTNYPFKNAILNYMLNGDVAAFKRGVGDILQTYPKQALDVLLNMIGSHDTVRALSVLSEFPIENTTKRQRARVQLTGARLVKAKTRLKLAAVLQYTLPGLPCVYYGDEAGVSGYEDPINRKTYPWGNEDQELVDFYKKLGEIRRAVHDELLGETHFSSTNDLVIMRRTAGKKQLSVLINNSREPKIRKTNNDYIDLFSEKTVKRGEVIVPAYGFLILKKIVLEN